MSKRQQKRRDTRRRSAPVGTIALPNPHAVRKGHVSPPRTVPPGTPLPPYVRPPGALAPTFPPGSFVDRMRRAGHAAGQVLGIVGAKVAPDVTTEELDAIAHQAYLDLGGYPSTLHYKGYTKSICTSVNEIVCHGIPDDRPLADGDIVNCDITIYLDGVHGDCSATFCVGDVDPELIRLVDVTRQSMWRGIRAVKPGVPLYEVGRDDPHAEAQGFSVVRNFVGHGIGDIFHTSPSVPHFFDPDADEILEAGMTFTIEPMINQGTWKIGRIWRDGWTAPTADGLASAQFEHTVLVTPTGVDVLTLRDGETPDYGD